MCEIQIRTRNMQIEINGNGRPARGLTCERQSDVCMEMKNLGDKRRKFKIKWKAEMEKIIEG